MHFGTEILMPQLLNFYRQYIPIDESALLSKKKKRLKPVSLDHYFCFVFKNAFTGSFQWLFDKSVFK